MGALIQKFSLVVGVDQQLVHLIRWLQQCPEVQLRIFDGYTVTRSDIADCDALFVRSVTRVNESLLGFTSVRFVATASSGIDHLDTAFLERQHIQWADAKGMNAPTVAQYVLYVLLRWAKEQKRDLSRCTLGVVGYGTIGKIVAALGNALGMRVLLNDPPLEEESFPFPEVYSVVPLHDLLQSADVVTVHVPLTTEGKYPTLGLLGERELKLLQTGILLINSSRGGIVDEFALLDMLQNGEPVVTAVDVWEGEPYPNTALVRKVWFPTPHIAGYSAEAQMRTQHRLLSHFVAVFDGCPEAIRKADREITAAIGTQEDQRVLHFNDHPIDVLFAQLHRHRPLESVMQQFKRCAAGEHCSPTLFQHLRQQALQMHEVYIPASLGIF